MKLSISALSMAAGMLWGGALLLVGVANLIWPSYGDAFLTLTASIYPGYYPGTGVGSVIIGTVYGLVDGAIAGAFLGWFYNLFAGERPTPSS